MPAASSVFANNGFCEELGKTGREIIGKTDFDFPADLANKYREDDFGIMESGKSLDTVEERSGRREKAWVHVVKTPTYDEASRCSSAGNFLGCHLTETHRDGVGART